MPSSVVHVAVTQRLLRVKGFTITPELLLGSVAPDANKAIHMPTDAARYAAHFRNKDYSVWKTNLIDFITSCGGKTRQQLDFYAGYFFHIAGDIFWDELIQPRIFAFLSENGVKEKDFKKQKWAEIYRLDAQLQQQPEWAKILALFRQAEMPENDLANARELDALRQKICKGEKLSQKEKSNAPPRVLCAADIGVIAERIATFIRQEERVNRAFRERFGYMKLNL